MEVALFYMTGGLFGEKLDRVYSPLEAAGYMVVSSGVFMYSKGELVVRGWSFHCIFDLNNFFDSPIFLLWSIQHKQKLLRKRAIPGYLRQLKERSSKILTLHVTEVTVWIPSEASLACDFDLRERDYADISWRNRDKDPTRLSVFIT